MDIFYAILIGALCLGGLLYYRLWEQKEAYRRLLRWADGNEYKLETAVPRRFNERPAFMSSSVLQVVFHVRLRAPGIGPREGWVRMGGYFSGLLSDTIDVFWEQAV
ncbi:MAG TPA: hypothetical protein VGP72_14130 [Planctomycetota bacterium]|jgi:hypothetical protein